MSGGSGLAQTSEVRFRTGWMDGWIDRKDRDGHGGGLSVKGGGGGGGGGVCAETENSLQREREGKKEASLRGRRSDETPKIKNE